MIEFRGKNPSENILKDKYPSIDSSERLIIRFTKEQASYLLNNIIYNKNKSRAIKLEQTETLNDIETLLIKYITN